MSSPDTASEGGASYITNFIMGMLIPVHALLVPMYVQLRQSGLTNHWYTLLFPYVAFGLPISIMLIESYIASIPKELEEAAAIDGCGIFPMSVPDCISAGYAHIVHSGDHTVLCRVE